MAEQSEAIGPRLFDDCFDVMDKLGEMINKDTEIAEEIGGTSMDVEEFEELRAIYLA